MSSTSGFLYDVVGHPAAAGRAPVYRAAALNPFIGLTAPATLSRDYNLIVHNQPHSRTTRVARVWWERTVHYLAFITPNTISPVFTTPYAEAGATPALKLGLACGMGVSKSGLGPALAQHARHLTCHLGSYGRRRTRPLPRGMWRIPSCSLSHDHHHTPRKDPHPFGG